MIIQQPAGVDVKIVSGRTQRFDFVVGADGLHSNVRAVAFGDEAKFVRHMGYYIAIYSVPDFMNLKDAGKYYVQLGRRVGCFGSEHGQCQGVVLLRVGQAGL